MYIMLHNCSILSHSSIASPISVLYISAICIPLFVSVLKVYIGHVCILVYILYAVLNFDLCRQNLRHCLVTLTHPCSFII